MNPKRTGAAAALSFALDEAGPSRLGVLVVAENISLRLSGETSLPVHYLAGLQRMGMRVRGICHARVREELRADLPPELYDCLEFVEDTLVQRIIFHLGKPFPYRVRDLVFNQLIHVSTQLRIRRSIRRIIEAHSIDVIFEPAPIAPSTPSFLYGFDVPVVIGPMSGGMEFPAAFRNMDGPIVRLAVRAGRACAAVLHHAVPGKLQAAALLVGNNRTRRALPSGVRGRVIDIMESGVDLERLASNEPDQRDGAITSFFFCSRFVDWKGIKYLVEAFEPLARAGGARLDLVGDGELRPEIERQIEAAGLQDAVVLHGQLPFAAYVDLLRKADVYVTPSLRECGGMAMLEAMALGLPIVALRWGGGAQYADDDCALFVEPTSPSAVVAGLTAAMQKLAASPALRRTLGSAARQRINDANLGWTSKVARVADVLTEVVEEHRYAGLSAASGQIERPVQRTAAMSTQTALPVQ